MLEANEGAVLRAFTKVHGELSGRCSAEIVYTDDMDIAGVACMKDGNECWRATVAEIGLDLAIMQMEASQ